MLFSSVSNLYFRYVQNIFWKQNLIANASAGSAGHGGAALAAVVVVIMLLWFFFVFL